VVAVVLEKVLHQVVQVAQVVAETVELEAALMVQTVVQILAVEVAELNM
jgi:hypothetical protein